MIGRPPVKREQIVEEIRAWIVGGEFQPGARLPSRRECALRFSATLKTVQKALSSLEEDGVVVSRAGLGTFVADEPPHLHQFALAFPSEPGEPFWSLFWDHLANVGHQVVKEQGLRLAVYTGISRYQQGRDYQRLLQDVRHGRLAGLILASPLNAVRGTDLLDFPGLPRVSLASPPSECPTIGHVQLDREGFSRKAVAVLRAKGIRSTAILGIPGAETQDLLQQIDEAGIACPYQHQMATSVGSAMWARNMMRLMFDPEHPNRPQALIVLDDNLFAHALAGILDAGLRVPRDVEIITHSNFPWQLTSPVPITRLGYDMHSLLSLAMAELERQRSGLPPRISRLPAVYEDELVAAPQYQVRHGITEYLPAMSHTSPSILFASLTQALEEPTHVASTIDSQRPLPSSFPHQ